MALTQQQIAEKTAILEAYISENLDVKGALIPVMQKAQELFGYLSFETMELISERMDVPVSEIYGVATFYALFSLKPKGEYIISVCTGTACYVKGAQQIIDKFCEILGVKPGETTADGLFTIDALRCIGACGIAPAVTINGRVYPKMTVDAVAAVVKEYQEKEGK